MGAGNVGGSFRLDLDENGSVVEDSPCSVKGRSRSSTGSDGLSSNEFSASRVDFRERSLAGFGSTSMSSPAAVAAIALASSAGPLLALSGGNLLRPAGWKASLSSSSDPRDKETEADELEVWAVSGGLRAPSFSLGRSAGLRCRELSGRGSLGSGESESW